MRTMVATVCAMLVGALCFAQDSSNSMTLALTKKLDSIIIPEVHFLEANLADVVQFLTTAAADNDADKAGVNIVLMDKENRSKITITLKKVSLHKTLKYIAEMAGLSVDVEEAAVVLRKPK